MSWSAAMFVYGGGHEIFLNPFPKGPSWLTNVPLLTAFLGTFDLIDYPTFIGDIVLVLGGHQQVPNGVLPLNTLVLSHVSRLLFAHTNGKYIW